MIPAFRRLLLALALCCTAFAPPARAAENDVTFLTPEGAALASGRLLDHDGTYARVRTQAGPITLAIEGLTCHGPGCPAPGTTGATLRIAGAPAIARILMPALVTRFAAAGGYRIDSETRDSAALQMDLSRGQERLRISVLPLAEATALAAQADGTVDLVMALSLPEGLAPRRARVVALDALVATVTRDVPVTSLTLAQLRAVLRGDITSWAALGVPGGGDIRLLPGEDPALLGVAPGAGAVAAEEPRSALSGGLALRRLSAVGPGRALAIAGACGRAIPPSAHHVKTEDYPLMAPLYVILPAGRARAHLPEFVGFLDTPEAQRVVRRSGFVDQMPLTRGLGDQGLRLANSVAAAGRPGAASLRDLQAVIAALEGAEQVSLSFRFEDGGSALDAPSQGNVLRLARMIARGQVSGRSVILAGFSDGTGPAAPNRTLSLERAERVRAAVRTALDGLSAVGSDTAIDVQGHGEALPIACDDTDWGRRINRRVEVWLR